MEIVLRVMKYLAVQQNTIRCIPGYVLSYAPKVHTIHCTCMCIQAIEAGVKRWDGNRRTGEEEGGGGWVGGIADDEVVTSG